MFFYCKLYNKDLQVSVLHGGLNDASKHRQTALPIKHATTTKATQKFSAFFPCSNDLKTKVCVLFNY